MWRIKSLTEQFGMCGFGWYYEVIEQKLENGSDGQMSAFITVHLFIKVDGEWSKPIVGLGGSSFIANEKNGAYTSDECFKMALTDALSIACKSLGLGADVYFEKDRTKYDQETNANMLDSAIAEMRAAKSREELDATWKKYNGLQSNANFLAIAKEMGAKYPKA
jgi:hypothetical protein